MSKKSATGSAAAKNAVSLGLFVAITAALQMLSYFISLGNFSLSLVLVPIVVSAVLYGAKFSAAVGAAFGVITIIGTVTGLDKGAAVLFSVRPVITILLCLVKATLCGLAAGCVATLLKNRSLYLRTLLAAATAPVVNTGIFLTAMFLFYKPVLEKWAGGSGVIYYAFTGLIGVNFLIEFTVNMLLSSAIVRIVKAFRHV